MLLRLFRFSFSTTPIVKNIEANRQLLEKLQRQSNVVLTRDGYQVNVGVIVERKPIFLKADEVEMEVRRARYQMSKQHHKFQEKKYNLSPVMPKEIFDFPAKQFSRGTDEIPTHMREDPNNEGDKLYYYAKSKFYSYVDPNLEDPQQIQYQPCYHTYMMVKQSGSSVWQFPWAPINERQTLAEARTELLNSITEEKWTVQLKSVFPVVVHRVENDTDSQKARIKGTKTFYYLVNHLAGEVTTHSTWDGTHNWVPRGYFNKYVSRDVYEDFVGILSV